MASQPQPVQFENKKTLLHQMLKEIFSKLGRNCLTEIKQGQEVKHLFVL